MYYFLKSLEGEWGKYTVGSTFGSINSDNVKKIIVALPKSKEQKAIAAVLSDIDGLIDSLEKLITKKCNIKTAAMQQLLTGKKRLPGFGNGNTKYKQTDIGLIPEGWDVKPLGDIGNFSKGSGIKKEEAQSGTMPCVRYGEIYTKHNEVHTTGQ